MSTKKTDFKQQLEELEQIVDWFESSDVDIDQAISKFERGMELAASLEKQLADTETKVEEITRKFQEQSQKLSGEEDDLNEKK